MQVAGLRVERMSLRSWWQVLYEPSQACRSEGTGVRDICRHMRRRSSVGRESRREGDCWSGGGVEVSGTGEVGGESGSSWRVVAPIVIGAAGPQCLVFG